MAQPAQRLEISTPEAVALDVDVAGLGQRALAWLIDVALIFVAWFTVLFAVSYLGTVDLARVAGLAGWVQALGVLAAFALNWGYALIFEVAWRGQTPGKRLMHLRVVRLDGSPAGFLELALRNLCRGLDFLPAFYALGVVSMVATERSRRLGDLVAGTMVIREREFDLARYQVAEAPGTSGVAALPPEQLELLLEFLQRANTFDPAPRARLAIKLASGFARRLPEAERLALAEAPRAEAFLRALARGEA